MTIGLPAESGQADRLAETRLAHGLIHGDWASIGIDALVIAFPPSGSAAQRATASSRSARSRFHCRKPSSVRPRRQ